MLSRDCDPAYQSPLRREIEALNSAMIAAFKKNPVRVASFCLDNARIIGGGIRAVGRQQIDQYWAGATMFADWSLEVLNFGGDHASPWLLGRSTLTGKSGRTTVTEFVGAPSRHGRLAQVPHRHVRIGGAERGSAMMPGAWRILD